MGYVRFIICISDLSALHAAGVQQRHDEMVFVFHSDKALLLFPHRFPCSHVFDTERAQRTRDTNRKTHKRPIRVTSKKHAMKN